MSLVVSDGLSVVGFTELGVKLVHLNNGEDIIGRVFQSKDTTRIERAVLPNVSSQDGKRFSVSFMPYRPYMEADANLDIPTAQVMMILPVSDQMVKVYTQFTSSITIANTGDVPNLGL